MKRFTVLLILSSLLILTSLSSCPGPDTNLGSDPEASSYYFDSVAGNDLNTGKDQANPFQNLSVLNSLDLVPGDEIFLKKDSAWAYYIEIEDSGEASKPIIIGSYGTGAPPLLEPTGNLKPAVTLEGSYISVSGLHVASTNKGYGILLQAGTQGNIVEDCEIEKAGAGIVVVGAGHIVKGNNVHDLTMIRNTPGGDDDNGAVGIWLNEPVSNIKIHGNTFRNCMAESYDYGTDGGVMEVWGNASDIEFYANYSEGNNGFFEAGSASNASVTGISIHHNISVNDIALFVPHATGSFTISFSGISYAHNTVYCDTSYSIAFFHIPGATIGSGKLSVINNVLISCNPMYDLTDGGFDHRGNLYYWPPASSSVSLGITIEATETASSAPLLGTISASGYSIDPSSPARDSGVATTFATDYLGNSVPYNALYDRGAIEGR